MKLKMGDSENKKIETLSNYIIGKKKFLYQKLDFFYISYTSDSNLGTYNYCGVVFCLQPVRISILSLQIIGLRNKNKWMSYADQTFI